jgi:hypothetical protein
MIDHIIFYDIILYYIMLQTIIAFWKIEDVWILTHNVISGLNWILKG